MNTQNTQPIIIDSSVLPEPLILADSPEAYVEVHDATLLEL